MCKMYSHWEFVQMPNCTTCTIPQGGFLMITCKICNHSPADWDKHTASLAHKANVQAYFLLSR